MFNIFRKVKTTIKQAKKIRNLENLIEEQNEEWTELYAEKKELQKELENTIESKDIAEKRNVEYARLFKTIAEEINTNQYNSVENLQNKIKSMLCVGKHF